MKSVIALSLLLFSFAASAQLNLKAGVWGQENNDAPIASFTIGYELFDSIEPYVITMRENHNSNVGFGIDYFYRPADALKLSIGVMSFSKDLRGGEHENVHLGISYDLSDTVFIAYSHYSNGKTTFDRHDVVYNNPLNLIEFGIRFN